MKRVLSLVLMLTLVLSAVMPSFAEETAVTVAEVSEYTQQLADFGIIEGDGTGFNEAGELTRAATAKILAYFYGEQETAKDFKLATSFTDVDEDAWYFSWVSFAENKGWMIGGGPGTAFRPDDSISAQEVNQLMLRVLGYDVEWADVNAEATTLKVAVDAADKSLVLRGEAFKAIRMVLDVNKKDEEVTLGTSLELKDYEAPKAPVTEVAVESVTALNARQVQVVFNQAVVAKTVKTANVKVYLGTSTTASDWTTTILEDGKTAILGLKSAVIPQDTTVKVVAKDVENADGLKLAETTMSATLKDVTAPAVTSVVFTSSKTLEIMTTEPLVLETGYSNLHVLNNILVDGNKLVGSMVQDLDANKITVTFGAKIAVGTHEVTVKNYRDNASWLAPAVALSAEVIADTTAPTITSVDAGRKTVAITFDEAVTTIGNVTINTETYVDADAKTTDNKTWTITLDSGKELGLAFLIQGEISHYGAKDNEDNIAGTAAKPVKVAFTANDDTEVPTAVITVDASNNVIITFSEKMSDAGVVTVKNAAGTKVATNVVPLIKTSSTNTYKVSASTAGLGSVSSAANYTVELTKSKDDSVRENTIVATTATLSGADVVAPTIVNAVLTQAHTTKVESSVTKEDKAAQVTIYFSEAMDTATLVDANNYTFAYSTGTPVNLSSISGVTLAAASNAKAVTITFPGTGTNGVTAGANHTTSSIYALLLKDAAGNNLKTAADAAAYTFNEKITIANTAATFILADADGTKTTYNNADVVMTAPNTIKVGFSNPVAIVDPSDFVLFATTNTTTVKLIGIAATLSADSKVATITLNGNLTSDAKIATADAAAADFYLKAGNTKDVFGNKITAAATVEGAAAANASTGVTVVDYVAPTVSKVRTQSDLGADSKLVVLTFNEKVTVDATNDAGLEIDLKIMVQESTPVQLLVGEYDVIDDASVNTDGTVEILITKPGIAGKKVTVELLNGRYITDESAATTATAAFAAMTVKNADGSADATMTSSLPTFTVAGTSVHAAGDTIALTFNRAMTDTTLAVSDLAIKLNGDATVAVDDDPDGTALTLTTASIAWNTAKTVATITLDEATDSAFLEDGEYIAVAVTGAVTDTLNNDVATGLIANGEDCTISTAAIVKETTAPTVAWTSSSAVTNLVITFNEAVYVGGSAVADGATIPVGNFTLSDATKNITSATYAAAGKTVTFVIEAAVADDATIAANVTLTDFAGNPIASTVVGYLDASTDNAWEVTAD